MQKHFKHSVLALVLALVMFAAFPHEVRADSTDTAAWWDTPYECVMKKGESFAHSVSWEVSKNRSKYEKYENDCYNGKTNTSPKSFIIKRMSKSGYEYYLCWLTIDDRGGSNTYCFPDGYPRITDFSSRSGSYWNTIGYSITDKALSSNSEKCITGNYFFYYYTSDGIGEYSKDKKDSKISTIKHMPADFRSTGGVIWIWKTGGKYKYTTDAYTSLHYLKLYDPDEPETGEELRI